MIVKALILSIVCFGISNYSAPEYSRLFIGQTLDQADLVVEAEIIQVKDSTVVISIDKQFKGNVSEELITIKKFVEWSCASRWSNYEAGQKAIFCLQKRKDGLYKTVGYGNEGEFPIVNGCLYYITYLSRITYEEVQNYGAYRFSYKTGINGITTYLKQEGKVISFKHKDEIAKCSFLDENPLIQKIIAWQVVLNYNKFGLSLEERHQWAQNYLTQ